MGTKQILQVHTFTVQQFIEKAISSTKTAWFFSKVHYAIIDNLMDKDNEQTTSKMMEYLKESFSDLVASERKVARARHEFGWVHQTARYCQLVREAFN